MVSAAERTPTAEGSLEKTPLVHLLVYMADRELTGSIVLVSPHPDGPLENVIYFCDGAPAKIRTAEPIAYLGTVLRELRILTDAALSSSLAAVAETKELHGELLVRTGVIDRAALLTGLRVQAARKMAHIFHVPGETTFSFFENANLLEDWGGPELFPLDPLEQIRLAASARNEERIVDATLARLGATKLKLHEESEVERFRFGPSEQAVVEWIRSHPSPLADIVASRIAPEATIRLVVYTLLVTRHLDHGAAATPVGIGRPPDSARTNAPVPDGSIPVARVKLVKRPGAAVTGALPAEGRTELTPELVARREAILKKAESIDEEDFFQILGVARTATTETIRSAYFALAKLWHTDRLPAELADVREAASRVFARMSEAFDTLSDSARQQRYLDSLAQDGAAPDEVEQVQRAVEAATQFQHAEVFLKKHDLASAETSIARAYELDPDQSDHIALYATVQMHKRALDAPVADLIDLLTQAISKNEKCERAYFSRGILRKRLGEIEPAIADFRIAFELNPRNLDAGREVHVYEMRKARQSTVRRPGSAGPEGPAEPPAKKLAGLSGLFKLLKR